MVPVISDSCSGRSGGSGGFVPGFRWFRSGGSGGFVPVVPVVSFRLFRVLVHAKTDTEGKEQSAHIREVRDCL